MTANTEQLTILVTGVRGERIFAACVNGRVAHLERATRPHDHAVFTGRVENCVAGMKAAFVHYEDSSIGYLKYAEVPEGALHNRAYKAGQALKPGDLLAVQVVRYAQGTKQAKLTGQISLSGKYTVLTYGKRGFGTSSRLEEDVRQSLMRGMKRAVSAKNAAFPEILSSCGVILRTEAGALLQAQESKSKAEALLPVSEELKLLCAQMEEFLTRAKHLKTGSLLYRAEAEEVENEQLTRLYHYLRKEDARLPVELKCEDAAVYESLCQTDLLRTHEDIMPKLHDPSAVSLSALYRLDHVLEDLDKRVVWLKSGAFLVIDRTEAMTVIDVNSGKNIRNSENYFLKINLEAAEELMRQLRLRDITGIILVDFINMKKPEAREELAEKLRALAARDTVRTLFVDFTALGLAELTRAGT
ncbi:MAG: ribonuclease E/G [Lachnospiraceae bacterium]|nr:ribonuclease E/G [Lachnospiraceae bacterium]